MAKLSDTFLHLLGKTFDPITPEKRAELAQQQQQIDNQRLTALAHAASGFDIASSQPSPATAGVDGAVSPAPTRPSGLPVPGMSGYTMTPKQEMTSFVPFTQDTSGNFTQGNPISVPKGSKPIIGKPMTPRQSGGLGEKDVNKEWADLENDINPGSFKNKVMAQNLAKKQSAEAVLTLLKQANGNPNVLQSPEIAQSVAMLLQSGQARTAQEQLDKLTPSSLKGDIMKQLSYFSNQPRGLGQQAFFQSLSDTAQREGSLRGRQILQEQLSRLPRHEHLKNLDPTNYSRILAGHGVDLSQRDQTGAPLGEGLLGQGGNQPQAGATLGQTIRVRNKQTGQTGSMPAANYDPSVYDQL